MTTKDDKNSTLTGHQVRPLLGPVVPPATAAKIADWAKGKDYHVAGLDQISLDDYRDMGHAEKDALAEAVHDAYCSARGLPRVSAPQNLTRAADMVAEKFHFADGAAMRERSEPLYEEVVRGMATRPWLDNYITRQTIEETGRHSLSHFVNTWWREWTNTWTDGQKAFYEQCQARHIMKSSKTYSREELFESVQELLSSHPDQDYTYNHVADGLQIAKTPTPGAMPQRMKVKDVLEALSDPKQNIHEDVIKYATRAKKGKRSATVYKWAPLRRQLDRKPGRREAIISDAVLAFVREHPDSGKRAIREAMRSAFGQIANQDVDAALDRLILAKQIEDPKGSKRGAHGAFFYRAAPEVPQRPLDPKDTFGVGSGEW